MPSRFTRSSLLVRTPNNAIFATVNTMSPRKPSLGLPALLSNALANRPAREGKFKTDGGRIRYGQTNGYIFEADETGLVRRVKVPRMNKQLSRQWVQQRIDEWIAIARKTGDKDLRQIGRQLRQALADGRIEAIGMVTDTRGHLVFEDDRTDELRRAFSTGADDDVDSIVEARGTDAAAQNVEERGTDSKTTAVEPESPSASPKPRSSGSPVPDDIDVRTMMTKDPSVLPSTISSTSTPFARTGETIISDPGNRCRMARRSALYSPTIWRCWFSR
jgi:hypothetical protein